MAGRGGFCFGGVATGLGKGWKGQRPGRWCASTGTIVDPDTAR